MGTLSASYFEKGKAYLQLNEEEDNEDERNKRQEHVIKDALRERRQSDEQERDNGGEEDVEERKERSSDSSEDETDDEDDRQEIERRKESGRVCDSDDPTAEQEVRQERKPAWAPNYLCRNGRDVYHYAGNDIVIYESIGSYGSVMWPAALALCSYLDSNRLETELLGKRVLELGAGTGLVAIVASLLGGFTDQTDHLSRPSTITYPDPPPSPTRLTTIIYPDPSPTRSTPTYPPLPTNQTRYSPHGKNILIVAKTVVENECLIRYDKSTIVKIVYRYITGQLKSTRKLARLYIRALLIYISLVMQKA
ncbi:uncharacterized protein LOC132471494 isoform X4 [Gadus macrocephalus]|uniref:uncharacterized protein LOC132471494 isoform X4 n=1 Tax=Gadus macrocephalus TaxID=80720 RepID=UPI0028CB7A95|nr:uncharacterized protein LOC132471494 isoform X4 [Gadus macrocephalus]